MSKLISLEEIFRHTPYRSGTAFIDNAKKHGYTYSQAKRFLDRKVIHDQRAPKEKLFIPIVSKSPGWYQMDTFINQKQANGVNYLMLINVNTRKAYAYMMRGKGAQQVKAALNQFIKDEPNCTSILSDQDAAYLSNEVLDWMTKHNIKYTTTTDDNHNNLGIINRFMRTIRDLAVNRGLLDEKIWDHFDEETKEFIVGENWEPSRTIDPKEMKELVAAYNEHPHRITKVAPNNMTKEDEKEYIKYKKDDNNPYDFQQGDKVRIVTDKNPLKKTRRQVSDFVYTVDSKAGNLFNVIAADKSVNAYPGYKLVKAKGPVVMAKSLKDDKRGIVKTINGYDEKTDQYDVTFENDDREWRPSKYLREGNPTTLSRMERIYWLERKDKIPPKIRKYI